MMPRAYIFRIAAWGIVAAFVAVLALATLIVATDGCSRAVTHGLATGANSSPRVPGTPKFETASRPQFARGADLSAAVSPQLPTRRPVTVNPSGAGRCCAGESNTAEGLPAHAAGLRKISRRA